MRVAIIEDQPTSQAVVARALGEAGLDYFFATSLVDGMAETALRDPDIVLLDLGLPNSKGIATLKSWLEIVPRDVPVIVLSGHEDLSAACIEEGADGFFPKGRELSLLVEMIQQAVSRAACRREYQTAAVAEFRKHIEDIKQKMGLTNGP